MTNRLKPSSNSQKDLIFDATKEIKNHWKEPKWNKSNPNGQAIYIQHDFLNNKVTFNHYHINYVENLGNKNPKTCAFETGWGALDEEMHTTENLVINHGDLRNTYGNIYSKPKKDIYVYSKSKEEDIYALYNKVVVLVTSTDKG